MYQYSVEEKFQTDYAFCFSRNYMIDGILF